MKLVHKIIKFDSEGLIGLHFYEKGLKFPVVIGTYSEWQEIQITYLVNYLKNNNCTTEFMCIWCINHNISYQILYPINKKEIIENLYKYYEFVKLKKKLRRIKSSEESQKRKK